MGIQEVQTNDGALVSMNHETVEAARRLQRENPDWQPLALRIYIDGKGCDGFEYGVTFDTRADGDAEESIHGLPVVIDQGALPFLKGSSVTWVDDERGRGFLVENPNHKKFRGKFFKRKDWQSRLLGQPTASDAQ